VVAAKERDVSLKERRETKEIDGVAKKKDWLKR